MKQIMYGAAAAGMTLLSSFAANKHIEVYKMDTQASSLEWYAEKLSGKHNGTIALSGGEVINDHGNISASVIVDMKTISDKDLQGEWAAKLDKHLMSPDFFDSEKFPTAKFVTTSIVPIKDAMEGGMTHTVKGNLTIKDKTNEISFDAVIKSEGNKIACVGTAVVDRSKFDVKYGSKAFFPEIGDKMIYDEFKLKFNVVAVKN